MKKFYFSFLLGMLCFIPAVHYGQVSFTGSYSQDFNSLASTGSSNSLPAGWLFTETGTAANVNGMYSAGTGSGTAGDVYSFGALNSTERAFGTLLSGTLTPTIGASFTNNTGSPITTLTISYIGEQWRLGTINRVADRLDFKYSLNATSLNTGVWTDVDALDFSTPILTGSVGLRDGNAPVNRVSINFTLENLSIPNGATFFFKWEDFNVANSDDGLAIDDFTITTGGVVIDNTPPVVSTFSPANNATGVLSSFKPSLLFNEPIIANTGKINLIDNTSGQTQEWDVNNTAAITIIDKTLTINAVLKPEHSYAINIAAGAVKDEAGNLSAAINAWNFTTAPQQLTFNFNSCSPALGGFSQYSVAGAQTWACQSTFGVSNTGSVQINGFANGAHENEDWLISPAFDLTGIQYPLLSFATISAFEGPGLKLMVSTDYDGISNPTDSEFSWKEIDGHFPAVNSSEWFTTTNIDLSAYKEENVYIAFVYTSSPALNASRWTLDNFEITKSATPAAPVVIIRSSVIDFDYAKAGETTQAERISVDAYNLITDLTLTAPQGFQVSLDNNTYTSSVTIPAALAETGAQTVYVRFAPTIANNDYKGDLSVTTVGITKGVTLVGSSLRALKVVNWNIEWFGDAGSGRGPSNDNLQQQNVQAILKKLNADVYALSEVVNVDRLQEVVAAMPGYDFIIGDFGSYADDTDDVDFAGAQKLAFVYRTSVVKQLSSYGVLRNGGSSEAYRNWASGRYPYLMKAEVSLEGVTTTVNFVLIHGKANTGSTAEQVESWERRLGAAKELKDSLDMYYPFANVVVLGDFNDDLDETIASGIPGNKTSYIDFKNDTRGYMPLTLPLSLNGEQSTVSHENVIDHQVSSNEMGIAYVPGSADIRTDVASWISGYGNNTSDHYPVVSRFDLHFFARPVSFAGFAGVVNGSRVDFSWYTNHEINSSYFVVERSRNGVEFHPVDSVQGLGDSREGQSYTLPVKPWPGQSHYRLRVTSLDGSIWYSEVLTINMKSASHLLRVTNPHASTIAVHYTVGESERSTLQLLDLNGRVYFNRTMSFVKGQNTRNLTTSYLPSGVYIVRIVKEGVVTSEKIFIGQ